MQVVFLRAICWRDAIGGQLRFVGQRIDAALLGNAHAVGQRLRPFGEESRHLLRAFEVVLLAIELHTLGRGQLLARLHAQQHIMRGGVVRIDIVQVVGRHHRDVQLLMHAIQQLVELSLRRRLPILEDAGMLLHFQIKVLRPKHLLVPARHPIRLVHLLLEQRLRNLTGQARRGDNQALRVLRQRFLIDTWPQVPPLGMRNRRQL